MNIIVHGAAGRMGQEMLRLIGTRADAAVASAVDCKADAAGILPTLAQAAPADIIIDFSFHTAVKELLSYACAQYLPVVIATTGHTEDERSAIAAAAEKIPVFYSGNMSVGIALLCSMAKKAAAAFPDADIEIVETHHCHKADAPSGTALMLADSIRSVRSNAVPVCGRTGFYPRTAEEIGIHSVRRGEIVGIHEVQISTATQTLTLKHEAYSRTLFAEGALEAARFLLTQPAGLYNMEAMIH